jgi:hypothetical protein
MVESKSEQRLMNTRQAARYLGVSRHTLRTQRCTGPRPNGLPRIPFVRLGARALYDKNDLDGLIEQAKRGRDE